MNTAVAEKLKKGEVLIPAACGRYMKRLDGRGGLLPRCVVGGDFRFETRAYVSLTRRLGFNLGLERYKWLLSLPMARRVGQSYFIDGHDGFFNVKYRLTWDGLFWQQHWRRADKVEIPKGHVAAVEQQEGPRFIVRLLEPQPTAAQRQGAK